jgi:hypothetical protein
VTGADPDADGEPAASLADALGAADPAAPLALLALPALLALLAGASLAEAPLAELAGDVGGVAGFEPSLPQAATTTVAPSGSALPPIPLVSTK